MIASKGRTIYLDADKAPTVPQINTNLGALANGGMNPPSGGTYAGVTRDTIYQQIQDMSAKRISTLDYLKKAYVQASFLKLDVTRPRSLRRSSLK